MKKEKKVLESIVESFKNENGKGSNLYYEKDAEIEFLQKEISTIMNEKSEKETIIKSNFYGLYIQL